jgi:hypothetical protein
VIINAENELLTIERGSRAAAQLSEVVRGLRLLDDAAHFPFESSIPMPRVIIGVMGPHVAGNTDMETHSFELGAEIGKHGYVLLTGGRNSGVMDAASRGAKSVGALVIGVLPSDNTDELSSAVDIPIITIGQEQHQCAVICSHYLCGDGAWDCLRALSRFKGQ